MPDAEMQDRADDAAANAEADANRAEEDRAAERLGIAPVETSED